MHLARCCYHLFMLSCMANNRCWHPTIALVFWSDLDSAGLGCGWLSVLMQFYDALLLYEGVSVHMLRPFWLATTVLTCMHACRYIVTVHTSDLRGAGTDANVYTRIQGTDAMGCPCSTGLMKLESSKENFERGRYALLAAANKACCKVPTRAVMRFETGVHS
jgi:hypothetical protein